MIGTSDADADTAPLRDQSGGQSDLPPVSWFYCAEIIPPPDWSDDAFGEYTALSEASGGQGEISPIIWEDNDSPRVEAFTSPPGTGPELAGELAQTSVQALSDDEVLSAAAAWRRLGAWAKAGELAAVVEFMHRRTPYAGGDPQACEAAEAEIQLALGRLTNAGSSRVMLLADALRNSLPGTKAALHAGLIDEAKAHVIAWGTIALDNAAARLVEQRVLPRASEMSTGQLRAAVARAVLQVDPDGAEKRRRRSEADARIELSRDDEHTASLAGRNLPAAQAVAADSRLTALAKALKADGDPRTLQYLRALVFTNLLLGTQPDAPPNPRDGGPGPRPDAGPAPRPDAGPRTLPDPNGAGQSPTPTDPHGLATPAGPGEPAHSGDSWGFKNGDLAEASTARPPVAPNAVPPGRQDALDTLDAAGVAVRVHAILPVGILKAGSGQSRNGQHTSTHLPGRDRPQFLSEGQVSRGQGSRGQGSRGQGANGQRASRAGPITAVDPTNMPGTAAARGGVAGRVRLIVPLTTLIGQSDAPGEITGYGPVTAATARALARMRSAGRWCYTGVDDAGRALDHGHIPPPEPCVTARGAAVVDAARVMAAIDADQISRSNQSGQAPRSGWAECDHTHRDGRGPYQVRGVLRHRIEIRDRTCRFPACRRPAFCSDIDHTRPWREDGPSCECNLSALCRRHHRLKGIRGWTLRQPTPGHLVWITPTGREYHIQPDSYPF